jgi:hypothetical protein
MDIEAAHPADARPHLLRALALDPDDGDAMAIAGSPAPLTASFHKGPCGQG